MANTVRRYPVKRLMVTGEAGFMQRLVDYAAATGTSANKVMLRAVAAFLDAA